MPCRYVSEFWENRVLRVRGASDTTVFAANGGLDGPWGLGVVGDVLLVASFATDRIHRYELVLLTVINILSSFSHSSSTVLTLLYQAVSPTYSIAYSPLFFGRIDTLSPVVQLIRHL
jgi:hypothetical protein